MGFKIAPIKAGCFARIRQAAANVLMHKITTLDRVTDELMEAFSSTKVVAMDVEGVDLGRTGQISLIQLAPSPEHCFLLDVLHANDDLIKWLRAILESNEIVKVIHDCRMDSDALFHLFQIKLVNVHDTSCWHWKTTGVVDAALNVVLQTNGLKQNVVRDSSVYNANHAFWATRPLTPKMVEWAAGDIVSMFDVYAKQLQHSAKKVEEIEAVTAQYLGMARDARVDFVTVRNVRAFIGAKGSNVRALQRRTNTLVYPRGKRGDASGRFLVYYSDPANFQKVVDEAAR